MKEGDVVLAALPQADGKTKLRPVLLLRQLPPPYNDYLVCGISTQLHQMINNFDELISENDDNFLAVTSGSIIAGTIGRISEQRHQKLLQRLSDYLLRKHSF